MKDISALPGLCFVFHYPDEGQLGFARLVFCLSLKLPKGKTSCIWTRDVFLKLPKGQNTFHPGSKCLFEAVKRTKHAASGPEMSF